MQQPIITTKGKIIYNHISETELVLYMIKWAIIFRIEDTQEPRKEIIWIERK